MKRFILIFAILALITSCRSQQCTVHNAQCTVIRDSVSVTYHPGTVLSLTDSTDFTDCAPTCGGAITVKPQHDGLTSQAQRCPSARPLQIPQKVRVDTLIVERWHTTEVKVESESGKAKLAKPVKPAKLVFYKNCTWGFFILILLLLGRLAFKLFRLFYLHR